MTHLAIIKEVFPSIQGEGYEVGAMQVFVRLSGCNLACNGCDTDHLSLQSSFPIFPWPGRARNTAANPVSPEGLVELLSREYPLASLHSVSFTGGEPMIHHEFLVRASEILTGTGIRVFVETNGTLAEGLDRLVPIVSFWSVDLKVSRAWGLDEGVLSLHEKFVSLLRPEKSYLKLVVSPKDSPARLCSLFNGGQFRRFRLAIQPYADPGTEPSVYELSTMLEWVEGLSGYFSQVRWIPQLHKLLRIS